MTVAELIKALQEHPPDMQVYVDGLDGGIDDLDRLTEVQVARDVSTVSYHGAHACDPEPGRYPKNLAPGLLLG